MVNNLPYSEALLLSDKNQKASRIFSSSLNLDELKWHWDEEDRIIYIKKETDWLIQLDNELPKSIKSGLFIPKGMWHRLIKGSGDLELVVEKIYK